MGKIMRNGVQYGVDTADVLSTVAECDASASGGKGTTQVASAKALSELNSNLEEELGSRLGGLTFGVDAEGNYGYKKEGADTVIPFRRDIGLIKTITTGTGNISGSIPDETKIILVTGTYGNKYLYEVPILCDSKSSGTSVGKGISGIFNSNGTYAGASFQITYDHATKTYSGYAHPNYGSITINCYGYI